MLYLLFQQPNTDPYVGIERAEVLMVQTNSFYHDNTKGRFVRAQE